MTSPKMPEVGRAVAKFAETYHAAHAKRCSGQLLRGTFFKQRLVTKPRAQGDSRMILEYSRVHFALCFHKDCSPQVCCIDASAEKCK